jgi:hypothetical protein
MHPQEIATDFTRKIGLLPTLVTVTDRVTSFVILPRDIRLVATSPRHQLLIIQKNGTNKTSLRFDRKHWPFISIYLPFL